MAQSSAKFLFSLVSISLLFSVGCTSQFTVFDVSKLELTSAEMATDAVGVVSNLKLNSGQSLASGELKLMLQSDGNLVLSRNSYRGNDEVLWDSHTGGRTCGVDCYAVLESSGNFVLYIQSQILWHSHSAGHPGARLVLASAPPYLSVRADEHVVWAAGQKLNWFTGLDKFVNYGADRPGLSDYMSLFQEGAPWPQALSKVNVLKLYTQAFQSASDADLRTIFAFARKHDIALAIEFPPIEATGADCQGEGVTGPDAATIVATRIQSLGGVLAYVAMDEPMDFFTYTKTLKKLTTCPFKDLNGLAQNVAKSVKEFRAIFPAVQVGDIETQIVPPALGQWADAYEAAVGVPLAFYHDDALVETPAFKQNIAAVQQSLAERNIPYGLIRNGNNDATSDAQWVGVAIGRIQTFASYGVAPPDQNIFQSWNAFPRAALPETSSTTLTSVIAYMYPPAAVGETVASSTLPIYRLFLAGNGDFLYSTSSNEGIAAGYVLNGVAFNLFGSVGATRSPLYRCSLSQHHFLSGDVKCEGGTNEVSIGYVEPNLSTRARNPIYRCRGLFGNIQTLNPLECQSSGYTIDGVLGYAP